MANTIRIMDFGLLSREVLFGLRRNTVAVVGGRIRFYFTPRSGCELSYRTLDWFAKSHSDYHSCWLKVDFYTTGFLCCYQED